LAVGKKVRKARPADVIRLAGVLQIQAVGLLPLLLCSLSQISKILKKEFWDHSLPLDYF